MEISGIEKVQSLKKLVPKEGIQAARVEDTLTISTEAQKKAEWVEMLKKMPDIRPEKIEAALSLTITPAILRATAQKMLDS